MGPENFLCSNKIATTVPTSGNGMSAFDAQSPGNVDSASSIHNKEDRATDSDDFFFLRTPPTRTSQISTMALAIARGRGGAEVLDRITKMKLAILKKNIPTDLLSSAIEHNVNWAPVGAKCVENNEESTERTDSLSDESSTKSASVSPISRPNTFGVKMYFFGITFGVNIFFNVFIVFAER